MFDVLVYLYENYWRADACPDEAQLARKLTAVGFENDEIQEALTWLSGLTVVTQELSLPQGRHSVRIYTAAEHAHLGDASISFITFLESAGVLPPAMREIVVDRAMATGAESGTLSLEDMKIIVLMVFWSRGEEPDALILDELFVDPDDRLIH